MKHYKYYYLAALSLGLLSSCADDLTQNMTVESVPLSVQVMEELKNLEPLKSYKTASNMSQNFKIGGAVSAEDFAKGGNIGALASANLDEVTTKTEMLYGSCVADDGATDFGNVNTLVDAAKKANVGVFGSAIIWNSNQRPAYYQALFETRGMQIKEEKKKEREAQGGGAMIEKEVSIKKDDLTKYEGTAGHTIGAGEAGEGNTGIKDSYGEMHDVGTKVDFPNYIMGYIPKMTSEGLESKNPGGWYQYFLSTGITADKNADTKYRIKFTVKAAGDCSFDVQARWSWSEDPVKASFSLKQSDDFVEVTKDIEGVKGEKFDLIVQTATEPTFVIKRVEVFKEEQQQADEPDVVLVNMVENSDCEGSENGNYVARIKNAGGDVNASFSDGGKSGKCIKIDVAAKVDNPWDNQFFITVPDFKDKIDPESKVELKMDVKAAVAQKISVQTHAAPGDYMGGFGDINAETDWKTFTLKAAMPKTDEKGQSYSLAFNLNDGDGVANTFYLDNITLTIEQKIPAGEISGEEKSKILTNVIDNWVKGLMDNTSGYVKAWDVVSDPVSDGAVQKDGVYGLQSTDKPNPKKEYKDVFFWQDYLGDVDYVRYAVSAARRHFKGAKEDLKLFVNDYGLDSDPKKCESLVKWLGKWENDTVKIDGIGVQLHLTCSENESDNTTTISNISTMLSTLAATGKLVRISELDVVFKDNSGAEVKVSSDDYKAKGCEEKIGAFYKSVIAAYLSGVPSAQQYGICQWSLIDENDLPKGLWSDKFLRKQTFKGFADGLSGK